MIRARITELFRAGLPFRTGIFALAALFLLMPDNMNGQDKAGATAQGLETGSPQAPETIEVRPVARDEEIAKRLTRILNATGWFQNPGVRVEEGVVFLTGTAREKQYKEWAGNLAQNTRDVVAVVNKLEVPAKSIWTIQPALDALQSLFRNAINILPIVGFSALVLLFFVFFAVLGARALRSLLRERIAVPLLRQIIARAGGIVLLLFGLYLILRISGLSRLAFSVLGGTGLVGLVIGIAFRDITENFLASVLLTFQRPFRAGDLVEISETLGYIQQLNVRTTVLMTLDGNHVQIPNATVYKSVIRNYTSNPNRREDFLVGIGYDAPIDEAQKIALKILLEHPAVLQNPEPWVLVDNLGSATVNLRIYFWLDGSIHSWLKVRSSVIRLIKRAFQQNSISMPDPAREIIVPQEIPVRLTRDLGKVPSDHGARHSYSPDEGTVTESEAGLNTESKQIQEQAKRARKPEQSEDLLNPEH